MKPKKTLQFVFALVIMLCIASPAVSKGRSEAKLPPFTRLTEEPVTLTYWAVNTLGFYGVSNYSEVALYKLLERETGVIIDFRGPATTRSRDVELQRLIASGRLPDIIEYNWKWSFPDGPDSAIDDGVVRQLDSLVEKYAPNFLKVLEENEKLDMLIRSRSGRLYAFPGVTLHPESRISFGPIVSTDLLESLEDDTPVTIEDWERMLRAFKKIAEIERPGEPFTPYILLQDTHVFGGRSSSVTDYVNIFASNIYAGAYGTSFEFFLKNGQIEYGPILPVYRTMLEKLHAWYSEGLIDFARDASRSRAEYLITAGCAIAQFNGFSGRSVVAYQGIPYPTDGDATTPHIGPNLSPIYASYNAAAVTTANEYPELSARWLDAGYGERGAIAYNFGVESESYEMGKNGPVLLDDIRTNLIECLTGRNSWNGLELAKYSRVFSTGPFIRHPDLQRQLGMYDVKDIWLSGGSYESPDRYSCVLTPAEEQELDHLSTQLIGYMSEMFMKFITGDEPIEMFDEYVRNMEEMGVRRAIALLSKTRPYLDDSSTK
jgi:putative aldouronate transport system substrate-binding protein